MRITAKQFYGWIVFVFACLGGVSQVLLHHAYNDQQDSNRAAYQHRVATEAALRLRDALTLQHGAFVTAMMEHRVVGVQQTQDAKAAAAVASIVEELTQNLGALNISIDALLSNVSACMGNTTDRNMTRAVSLCVEPSAVSLSMPAITTNALLRPSTEFFPRFPWSTPSPPTCNTTHGHPLLSNASASLCSALTGFGELTSWFDDAGGRGWQLATTAAILSSTDVTWGWTMTLSENHSASTTVFSSRQHYHAEGAMLVHQNFTTPPIGMPTLALANITSHVSSSLDVTVPQPSGELYAMTVALESRDPPSWCDAAAAGSICNTSSIDALPNTAGNATPSHSLYYRQLDGNMTRSVTWSSSNRYHNTSALTMSLDIGVRAAYRVPINVERLLQRLKDDTPPLMLPLVSRANPITTVWQYAMVQAHSSSVSSSLCGPSATISVLASSEYNGMSQINATITFATNCAAAAAAATGNITGTLATLKSVIASLHVSSDAVASLIAFIEGRTLAATDNTTGEPSVCVSHQLCFVRLPSPTSVNRTTSNYFIMSYYDDDEGEELFTSDAAAQRNTSGVPAASGLWWSLVVVWATVAISCSCVILVTRRLYVLPTVALRSVLAAAFQATPAGGNNASPHTGAAVDTFTSPSGVMLGGDEDIDGHHSFGQGWGGSGEGIPSTASAQGPASLRYGVSAANAGSLRGRRSRQSSLSSGRVSTTVGANMNRQRRGAGWAMLGHLLASVTATTSATHAAMCLDPVEMDALSDASSSSSNCSDDDHDDVEDIGEVDAVRHMESLGGVRVASVEAEDDSSDDATAHRCGSAWQHRRRVSSIAVAPEAIVKDNSTMCSCLFLVLGAALDACSRAWSKVCCTFRPRRVHGGRHHHNGRGDTSKRHQHLLSSAEGHELQANLGHVFQWVSCVAKYVPKEVVSDLMRSGGGNKHHQGRGMSAAAAQVPHMSQRIITLLFCDIENFTTFCEHVPPEDMVDLLEMYFAKMTSVLLQHGCTIDKYIGDAIMGFWGAPLEYHNQGFSACCAALHMQYAVAKLRPYFERFQHYLNVRVGIHRGVAAVGNIGCSVRLSYTALGDVVNTAARLEGLNKHFGTRICVSQSVVNDIEGHSFAFRALGSVRVKGKLDALSVYELVGVRLVAAAQAQGDGKQLAGPILDTRSEAVHTHQTGLSTATDKFAELNVESELLTAKRFKTVTARHMEILFKIESAVQLYQHGDIKDAVAMLEQVLHEHSRTLMKLEIDVGKLREQTQRWKDVHEQLESGALEDFDPSVTMNEK